MAPGSKESGVFVCAKYLMHKLKTKDIARTRADLLQNQLYRCALCGQDCSADPVLDHNHKQGFIRAVLHRQCNALLGRIENNAPRHLVPLEELAEFLRNAANYLDKHSQDQTGLLHPTYKSADEKKELAKKRAKRKRKEAKLQAEMVNSNVKSEQGETK